MAVWQSLNTVDPTWVKKLTPYQAACMFWFGAESDVIRLVTDPATLRDCWHCGRVMGRGQVDEMGRDWCGCEPEEATVSPGGPTTVATAKKKARKK